MRRRLSPSGYLKVTRASLASLYIIVVTGAMVRLTGSGLGCADWPRCSKERFIDVSTGHGAIEQINRLFTGVVSLSVALAVLGSLLLPTRRRTLTRLSLGLVAGVLAQIVIGGIVVLTGLNPWANMAHFLVSMILLANALWLHRLADCDEPVAQGGRGRFLGLDPAILTVAILGLCAVVTGTVVTASGPHAGDEDAVRFGFSISSVARVHSISVITTIAAIVWLLLRTRKQSTADALRMAEKVRVLLGVALLQALVGYVQYFADVPAFLVACHIALAAGVWLALVDLVFAATSSERRVQVG